MGRDYAVEYQARRARARAQGFASFYYQRIAGENHQFESPPDGTRLVFPDGQTWIVRDGLWEEQPDHQDSHA